MTTFNISQLNGRYICTVWNNKKSIGQNWTEHESVMENFKAWGKSGIEVLIRDARGDQIPGFITDDIGAAYDAALLSDQSTLLRVADGELAVESRTYHELLKVGPVVASDTKPADKYSVFIPVANVYLSVSPARQPLPVHAIEIGGVL